MNLTEIREKIDKIDENIIELLLQRLSIMEEVVRNKVNDNMPIIDTKREENILKKLEEASQNEFKYTKKIFEEIMKVSKEKQADIIESKKI